jgi:hypothetical protein
VILPEPLRQWLGAGAGRQGLYAKLGVENRTAAAAIATGAARRET